MKGYNLKNKMIVISHYTYGKNTCVWNEGCNISDPDMLAVDHINNNGAEHRKQFFNSTGSGIVLYRWIIINNFPEGFQILCHNHNIKKELIRRRKEGLKHKEKHKLGT